jgi:glycosyltransferase involved in cell wall biosynthesis
VKDLEAFQEADVLDIHCMHGGFFNYLALPSLTAHKPAVLTLHDMWPFTGHCSFSYDCDRWQTGCGRCPYPGNYPAIKTDGSRIEWKLKEWVYRRSNLVIVTLCRLRTEQVRRSLLSRFPIVEIPNGVDTEVFRPMGTEASRELLGIPSGKRVLMFASAGLASVNKGGDLLLKALEHLPRSLRTDMVLLTMGDGGDALGSVADVPSVHLGYVSYDRLKAVAFSAADVFVLPSRAETLPLVLLESMACGTPVVSFDVGGVSDLVRPGSTGYLARPEDFMDLRDGLAQLLGDPELCRRLSERCRTVAVDEYSTKKLVQRYLALYRTTIDDFWRGRPVRPPAPARDGGDRPAGPVLSERLEALRQVPE